MQAPESPEFGVTVMAEVRRIAKRELARHARGLTLETRALVNEVYIKLYDRESPAYANRAHLLATAAQAIRQIVIDHARARQAERRGGGAQAVSLAVLESGRFALDDAEQWLRVDQAMRKLGQLDPRLEKVAELRYFAGLEVSEVAEILGLSEPTIKRDSRTARAFLAAELA
jgi:RNA polymerase sigma factor (TIGR02999 family)